MTNADSARRDAYIRMGYEVDTASEARVKSSTDQFVENLRRMAAGTDAAAASAQKSARTLAEAFDAQKNTVKSTVASETAELAKLRDQYDQTGAAAQKGLRVEGLRRTGGALTQLGFGELGGAVRQVGDVGQVAKEADELLGALGPLAPVLAGVAGAAIGFQIGLKILDAELADGKKALEGAVAGLDAYYAAVSKGTTQSIAQQKKALEDKNKAELAELEQLKSARDRAFQSEQKAGDLGARILTGVGDLTGAFKPVGDRIAELEKSTLATSNQLVGLDNALKSTGVSANDAAVALKAQQSQLMQDLDISVQAKRQELSDSKLSSEQMQNRVKDLKDEQAIIQSQLQVLEPLIATNDEAKKKYEALQSQMTLVNTEIQNLTGSMIAAKKASEDFNAGVQKLKDFGQTVADAAKKALAVAGKELDARDAREAAIQKKFNDDQLSIKTKSLEQQAAIQGKYNDKLVELARSLADEASASLRRLEQQRADLATSLGRDEAKSVRDANDKLLTDKITAARADEKAATDHYRRVADIQKAAQDREFDLIANRDFAGLFASRRQTGIDIQGENTSFSRTQQDSQKNLQQQQEDQARSFDIQRRERLIAYNQQLVDAKRSYDRDIAEQKRKNAEELKIASETRTKDLQSLSSKTAAELRIKSQAYDAELRMASLYGQARINAEAATQRGLLAQANQRLSALTSGASGGTYMTQNTTTSNNRSVQVNANGYGANEVGNQIVNYLRQIFK